MKVHENFTGGNIEVLSQNDNTFYVERNIRDTFGNWFYWAFCIEGAQGKTLTFTFPESRLGYYGPAVSHDLYHWHWLYQNAEHMDDDYFFTYTFGPEEDKVYFAHNILYHPCHFDDFAKKHNLDITTLCPSQKGRPVPTFTFGEGEKVIYLTSRHHACESTGSYVLEGVVEQLLATPMEGYRFICIPFMDYDGVVDGDQGKNRKPHDHNRDYDKAVAPIYTTTKALRESSLKEHTIAAFDFHAPWHRGEQNDLCYIVQHSPNFLPQYNRFAELLEKNMTKEAFTYKHASDFPPDFEWNVADSPNFSHWFSHLPFVDIALSFETPYFGTPQEIITPDKCREIGRCFAKTMKEYFNR